MSLRIKITAGDVVTWEYRASRASPQVPIYREPIRFEPPKALLWAKLWGVLDNAAR